MSDGLPKETKYGGGNAKSTSLHKSPSEKACDHQKQDKYERNKSDFAKQPKIPDRPVWWRQFHALDVA